MLSLDLRPCLLLLLLLMNIVIPVLDANISRDGDLNVEGDWSYTLPLFVRISHCEGHNRGMKACVIRCWTRGETPVNRLIISTIHLIWKEHIALFAPRCPEDLRVLSYTVRISTDLCVRRGLINSPQQYGLDNSFYVLCTRQLSFLWKLKMENLFRRGICTWFNKY